MHITASFGISQKSKNWKHTCLLSKKHRPYLYLFSKWWRKILQIRKWLTARGYFHSLVLMDLGEYFLPGKRQVEVIWLPLDMTKLLTFTIGESMSHLDFFRLFQVISINSLGMLKLLTRSDYQEWLPCLGKFLKNHYAVDFATRCSNWKLSK